jgi:peptide deformylase
VAILPVRIYGDPLLRERAKDVTAFDDRLRALVRDMFETMDAYHGVGLAGNQVGVASRVFVLDVPLDDDTRVRRCIANPEIDQRSGSETAEEGCLSIPGIYEEVDRSTRVRLRGADEHGKPVELEAAGYLARAIQHEVDHLNGVLFVDRLSPLKRQFLKKQLDALANGDVPEGYHPNEPARDEGEAL